MSPDQFATIEPRATNRKITDVVDGFAAVFDYHQKEIDNAKTQTKRDYHKKKLKKLTAKMLRQH